MDTSKLIAGIDVSHHNGQIDWHQTKAHGIKFCFIKATEGVNGVDPLFAHNATAAKAAGLLVGFYHFARPSEDMGAQAQHFQAVTKDFHADLPMALDVEDENGFPSWETFGQDIRIQKLAHFLSAIGQEAIIYTSPGWYKGVFDSLSMAGRMIWAARYGAEPDLSGTPWSVRGWAIWQSSETGTVPGVGSGNVDLNWARPEFFDRIGVAL